MRTPINGNVLYGGMIFVLFTLVLSASAALLLPAPPGDIQDEYQVSSAAALADQIRGLEAMSRSVLPEPPEIMRGPAGAAAMTEVTDDGWAESVEQAQGLVVVCFTSRYSPRSKDQVEVLKTLNLAGDVTILLADLDQNRRAVQAARPPGFPSIFLYKGGRILARLSGFKDKAALEREIGRYLQR
jgi:thioredoxin-like negative regulator of GroEL